MRHSMVSELPHIYARNSIKVERCPICGAACLPGDSEIQRLAGFDVRDGYSYPCRNLHVTFCQECLIGEDGVDIICGVIEADEAQRKLIANDAYSILKARHDELVSKIKKWVIGIVIVLAIIGICCLIWKPKEVFSCIGIIAMLIVLGWLRSYVGRR